MFSIYTDGSSHAKGGLPGGWAYVITNDDKPILTESGGSPSTTNNEMELTAAVNGLRMFYHQWQMESFRSFYGPLPQEVELVSDSQYVLGIASGGYSPVKNLELASHLRTLATLTNATCRWVRGHSGNAWNERCDSLAKTAKECFVPEKVKTRRRKKI